MKSSEVKDEDVEFVPARLIQVRANHNRVPRLILGQGLSERSTLVGTQYWIFSPLKYCREEFYWMHTNIIIEKSVQSDGSVLLQTASSSLYRVDFESIGAKSFPTLEEEFQMRATVIAARKLWAGDIHRNL